MAIYVAREILRNRINYLNIWTDDSDKLLWTTPAIPAVHGHLDQDSHK